MTIELNEQQLDVLKDALLVNQRLVKKEREYWVRIGCGECEESCTRQLDIIREIENMLH